MVYGRDGKEFRVSSLVLEAFLFGGVEQGPLFIWKGGFSSQKNKALSRRGEEQCSTCMKCVTRISPSPFTNNQSLTATRGLC